MYLSMKNDRSQGAGLGDYLKSIGDFKLLSAEEEAVTGARAGADQSARDHLVQANLRLVVRIAREFVGKSLGLEDLIAEGNLGLIRAAERFDPTFGVRFSTYASYWIRQAMREALASARLVRLPAHVIQLMREWRRAEEELRREAGRSPKFDEIADKLSLSASHRTMFRDALRAGHVLDAEDRWSGTPLEPTDPCESDIEQVETADELARLQQRLGRLKEPERAVLALRYGLENGEPMTLREIGHELGFSWEWCRRLQSRGITRLRSMSAAL